MKTQLTQYQLTKKKMSKKQKKIFKFIKNN